MFVQIIITLTYFFFQAPLEPQKNYHDLECQSDRNAVKTECSVSKNISY